MMDGYKRWDAFDSDKAIEDIDIKYQSESYRNNISRNVKDQLVKVNSVAASIDVIQSKALVESLKVKVPLHLRKFHRKSNSTFGNTTVAYNTAVDLNVNVDAHTVTQVKYQALSTAGEVATGTVDEYTVTNEEMMLNELSTAIDSVTKLSYVTELVSISLKYIVSNTESLRYTVERYKGEVLNCKDIYVAGFAIMKEIEKIVKYIDIASSIHVDESSASTVSASFIGDVNPSLIYLLKQVIYCMTVGAYSVGEYALVMDINKHFIRNAATEGRSVDEPTTLVIIALSLLSMGNIHLALRQLSDAHSLCPQYCGLDEVICYLQANEAEHYRNIHSSHTSPSSIVALEVYHIVDIVTSNRSRCTNVQSLTIDGIKLILHRVLLMKGEADTAVHVHDISIDGIIAYAATSNKSCDLHALLYQCCRNMFYEAQVFYMEGLHYQAQLKYFAAFLLMNSFRCSSGSVGSSSCYPFLASCLINAAICIIHHTPSEYAYRLKTSADDFLSIDALDCITSTNSASILLSYQPLQLVNIAISLSRSVSAGSIGGLIKKVLILEKLGMYDDAIDVISSIVDTTNCDTTSSITSIISDDVFILHCHDNALLTQAHIVNISNAGDRYQSAAPPTFYIDRTTGYLIHRHAADDVLQKEQFHDSLVRIRQRLSYLNRRYC